MKNIREFIRETIRQQLNENTQESNLILYHGSNTQKIFNHFHDNQFFTVNDYIASNYAYNFGGLMYKVKVNSLNPFELKSYHSTRELDKYQETIDLLKKLYNDEVANMYEKHYFIPSPSTTFGSLGYDPIIKWAKSNGYDSLRFMDESFDTYVRDITYLIFDGNKPNIIDILKVEDAVESNFSKDFESVINTVG